MNEHLRIFTDMLSLTGSESLAALVGVVAGFVVRRRTSKGKSTFNKETTNEKHPETDADK